CSVSDAWAFAPARGEPRQCGRDMLPCSRYTLVERQAEPVDDFLPARFFLDDQFREFRWHGRGGREIQRGHLLAHVVAFQDLADGCIQAFDNVGWRACGNENRIPRDGFESWIALRC